MIPINTKQQPRADEEPDEWDEEEYEEPLIYGYAYSDNYGRSKEMDKKITLALTEQEIEILEFCLEFLNEIHERLEQNGEISEDFAEITKQLKGKKKKVGF